MRILKIIVAIMIVLYSCVWCFLSTAQGKGYLQHFIKQLSNDLGYQVEVKDIGFNFPFSLFLNNLSIADSKGKWIEIDKLEISITPIFLLTKEIFIHNITADKIEFFRVPILLSTKSATQNNFDVRISQIEIKKALITAIAKDLAIAINGSLEFDAESNNLNLHTQITTEQAILDMEVNGSTVGPIINAQGTLRGLSYNDKKIEDIRINADANFTANKGLGSIKLHNDTNVEMSLNYSYAASNLALNEVYLHYLDNKITGALDIDTDKLLIKGEINGNFEKLEQIASYLDSKVKGAAIISAQFLNFKATQKIISKIKLQELSVASAKIPAMDLNMDLLRDYEKTKDWQINLKLSGVNNKFQAFEMHLKGNYSNHQERLEKRLKLDYISGLHKNITIKNNKSATVILREDEKLLFLPSLNVGGKELSLHANLKTSDSLQGKINLVSDLSVIGDLLLPPEHLIKGDLKVDLAILGTYAAPSVSGNISLNQAAYTYLPLGLKLQHINANIAAIDNKFIIKKFELKDKEKHHFQIKGEAYLGHDFNYNFLIDTQKFNLTYPNVYTTFAAEAQVKGDNRAGRIKGKIDCKKLEIYLPNHFNKKIATLNVVETIPASPEQAHQMFSKFKYPIVLDLVIKARDKVFVRGWGVDAELKGEIFLKGLAAKPEIIGKLSSIRGRYEDFGKHFKLKQAELLFEGAIPPSPYINIIGSYTSSGVEIMPIITGPIMNPTLKIEASPSMSPENALSVLLFGKDHAKISPFQAIELTNSLRKLTSPGSSSSFDPMRKIRNAFGLDDITVGNKKNGDKNSMSIGAEKHILNNARLKVNKGAAAKDAGVGVEIDLTPNVSIENKSATDGSSSFGVNWKYNY